RTERNFESGIAAAIEAVLASPQFVFRLEPAIAHPATRAAAKKNGIERIGDVELASRLSFFPWAGSPDDELLNLATRGKLTAPAVGPGSTDAGNLAKQVKRMVGDPRAEALSTRFAAQWLRLNDVE